MRTDDLPLFNWTPPCKVIPFPARHRVGRVRRVAEVLSGKRGRDANAYWRRTVETMAEQMSKAGVPKDEAERQLRDFFDAVQHEMQRRAYQHHGSTPGGAA